MISKLILGVRNPMGVPTNYYVDPSLGSDTGDGSLGTPWGRASGSVVQYALDTITRDSSNGDQINIKAGTDDVLSAALNLTTYGAPVYHSPLIFRGYTSAANDGGIGGISGAGLYAINAFANSLTGIWWRDLHLHNCGSANVLFLHNWSGCINCELDNSTGNGIQHATQGTQSIILNNNFHNIGGYGINITASGGCLIKGNYFKNETNDFIAAIFLNHYQCTVENNIISVDSASDGILLGSSGFFNVIRANSILSSSGTGAGIDVTPQQSTKVYENLVEGFSGSGGIGIAYHASEQQLGGNNAVYNCATTYSNQSAIIDDLGDIDSLYSDETLSESPFAKDGSDTFSNRFAYFVPKDVGNIWGGIYPIGSGIDKGAVQHQIVSGNFRHPLSIR